MGTKEFDIVHRAEENKVEKFHLVRCVRKVERGMKKKEGKNTTTF